MHKKKLQLIKEKILQNEYIVTYHARKEMNNDDYSIFDVERGILTGEIIERQNDIETGEYKYRIKGKITVNDRIEIVCKLGPTNKLVIITVYKT
ncbi:MAG: DUF4258 domain-containing protein [Acidobacteria bacterium]|nr:DUF4258 domain-containing protein [Acidobacteriota bacterium]